MRRRCSSRARNGKRRSRTSSSSDRAVEQMATVATAPHAAPHKSFRDVWLITIGHSLTHWYPATFYLLLPIIGRELDLSYSQIGLIMTCQYIAGASATVPCGALVDTVGENRLLRAVSLFWIAVPYLLMPITHSY